MENSVLERELLELDLIERVKRLLELELSDKDKIIEGDLSVIDRNVERRKNTYSLIGELLKERSFEETNNLITEVDKHLNDSEFVSFKKDDKVIQMLKDDICDLIETSYDTMIFKPAVLSAVETVDFEEAKKSYMEPEVDKLLNYIDERIRVLEKEVGSDTKEEDVYTYFGNVESKSCEPTTDLDLNNLFDPKIEEAKKEKRANLENELKIRASQKLTREEIDVFIKKIDDKLAELEASANALDSNRFRSNEEF